jgi:two-component system cell cycle sensor histidine kinase/response regulator CckA
MSNVKKDFDVWSKDISASTVLHSLPDAVFITDPQMRIFYFNLAAENLTGFKSREALGMYCKDILKSGICETECAVKRALDADKNIFNIETTIVTATGQTLPILISALLIKDATGNIFGYLYSFRDISVLKKVMSDLEISRAELTERNIELARTLEELARDITERKQAEAVMKLRYDLMEYAGTHSLEEFLQKTLDEIGALTNSPIGFYHFVEPDQKTLSLQAWSTRTEKEFCTAKGKGMHYRIDQAGVWVDCVHERRPVIHNDYISLPHRKGLPEGHAAVIRELVVPIMREDHIVAILGIGNKPMDYTEKDAELVSFIADVAWEITKRKQAEEMLEKKSEEQTLLLDNIQTLIWYLKDAETQGIVNKACADFFGKKKEDLENKNLSDFMSKKEAEICIAGNKEVFEKKVTIHTEEWTKNAKGEKRLIAITKTPKIGENGNVEYVVCSAEDITEHKQADEALLRAEQLKVAGDLAVGLTHELKNSLTGIKISIEVLLDELVLSKDDRKVLMNMINETRRIELLIKDLLNFARPSKPQFAFVNINDVLDTALKLSLKKVSTLKNHGRSIDMVKEFDYHIPRTMADQMKLQQVFMNLLLNAVEAMQSSGSLKVQTSYNASNDLVHISISDTGKGIDHKLIDKIFDPFFTTKPKGTGLGLPISKRLIEQHGGNIRVETSLGKGTTFNIFLPVKQF